MSVLVAIFDDGLPLAAAGIDARALARLGVTEVTLADGPTGSAVVLAGWSFDGRRHEQAVVDVLAGSRAVRLLHGIADVVLRPGGDDPNTANA